MNNKENQEKNSIQTPADEQVFRVTRRKGRFKRTYRAGRYDATLWQIIKGTLYSKIFRPIYKTVKALRHPEIRHIEDRNVAIILRAKNFFGHYLRLILSGVGRVLRFVSPLVLPLLGVGIIGGCVWFAKNYDVGLEVSINGMTVACVENEAVYNGVRDRIVARVEEETGTQYSMGSTPVYRFVIIEKDTFSDLDEVERLLYSVIENQMKKSFGLFVDGTLICSAKSEEDILSVLDFIKKPFLTGAKGETVTFTKRIEIKEGEYDSSYLKVYNEIIALFTSSPDALAHVVLPGETAGKIAKAYGVSLAMLQLMNPYVDLDYLSAGSVVYIGTPTYNLGIKVEREVSYTQPIPFTTVRTYSDTLYETEVEVKQEGENGTYQVTEKIIEIDGVEVSRKTVSTQTLKNPLDRVIIYGSKTLAPSGSFRWPLDYGLGTVTSIFGYRLLYGKPNFHNALDIAAAGGTKIYAADAGVVYDIGWQENGLGNYVKINHGGNIITIYGHCSRIASKLKVGQTVKKGQLIAYVGTTGNSTGNHLHFAIYNMAKKTYYDPQLFVVNRDLEAE